MAFKFLYNFFKANGSNTAPKAAASVDGHEAAAWTRERSRIYGSSPDNDSNPNPTTRYQILGLARYASRNFPLAGKILDLTECNAIGAGLVANAATEDKDFNKAASAAFEEWAANAFASSNSQYNFYEMQKLMARELILAGEVFVLLQKTASGYPQIRLVKSESVRHSGSKDDTSLDGLWQDEFGRTIAYNVFFGKQCQKISADNVVHIIRHTDIDQLRGMSAFRSSLNPLRDFHDLMHLETKATKIHSRIAVVIEKTGGEAGQSFMGGEDMRLEKAHYAEESKAGLRDISIKIDALLLRDSANAQRFSDYDRRLDKMESKVDRLNERLYSPSPNGAH